MFKNVQLSTFKTQYLLSAESDSAADPAPHSWRFSYWILNVEYLVMGCMSKVRMDASRTWAASGLC